ncbi:phage holin [Clostridium chromiireducens]|uniref:Bacteriophage holin n=1 Tax=Clostridium chromiireducens TaxID=225345 RepID=A0A1V4IW72_9CLOT|nr:phage holin [Clostridium chromiireducens]OPJ63667.1 bacteriophage holin [Clostridium chromiireducens]
MFIMNLRSRIKNQYWWIAMISAVIVFLKLCKLDVLANFIPTNYGDIILQVFAILTMLGITVDTSTKGVSDQVVADTTVQAINSAEEVKVEGSTTAVNSIISENSQDSLAVSEATSSDKESETNESDQILTNVQVSSTDATLNQTVEVAALQVERDALKVQIQTIQAVANGNLVQS